MYGEKLTGNFAYIDNQNLFMATSRNPKPWNIDMKRFRVYLNDKYRIERAYLFMGALLDEPGAAQRYQAFEDYGYELVFRPHSAGQHGLKKGNVDTDVVFKLMLDLYEEARIEKMYLVSGDGDYWRTVEHLKNRGHLGKVLLPSRRNASSLYKALPESMKAVLDTDDMRRKLGRK